MINNNIEYVTREELTEIGAGCQHTYRELALGCSFLIGI